MLIQTEEQFQKAGSEVFDRLAGLLENELIQLSEQYPPNLLLGVALKLASSCNIMAMNMIDRSVPETAEAFDQIRSYIEDDIATSFTIQNGDAPLPQE